jgi:hypothetical protein
MSDPRSCSFPLASGLIGGLVGAALVENAHHIHATDLKLRINDIKSLEQSRLAEQWDLHRLHQAEAGRNHAERSFQHAVLWLGHCNNDERLEYLVTQNQLALARQLAALLAAEVERDPSLTSHLVRLRETRHQLAAAQQTHRARQPHRAALQRARWTAGSVFATGLLIGCLSGIPALVVIGTAVLPCLFLFGMLLALFSPAIAARQTIPARFRSEKRTSHEKNFATLLVRTELLDILRTREMTRRATDIRNQEDELRRHFGLRQPQWLDAAATHVGALRPQLETLQQSYPPRVRCNLAALPDEAIARHLRNTTAPLLAQECERLLQI